MGIFDRIKTIWKANSNEGHPEPIQRTLTNLRVGDIVSHDLNDYKVEGVTTYRSGGQVRYGYLLSDGVNTRYMIVEQKETVRVIMYETLDARLENPDEINHEMIYDDVAYYETARGESQVSVQGQSAFSPYDVVYWWLHQADGGRGLMLFEWQKGEILIRIGQATKPYEINILAGSE
jgi:hypothetical protein